MQKQIQALLMLSVLFAAQTAAAAGFGECLDFFPDRKPPSVTVDKARPLCYESFAILHSGDTKTPVFVAERLNRQQLLDAMDEERTDKFFSDARLPVAERAALDDYKGSGYDRGHMAPAADMPSSTAMAQSFSLANMVPQDPTNNRKAWAYIEKGVRHYAKRARGDVYVMTGPLYAGNHRTIGNGVAVPTHLFKVVYAPAEGKSWVHVLENSKYAKPGKPISYSEFVSATGLQLIPSLSNRNQ